MSVPGLPLIKIVVIAFGLLFIGIGASTLVNARRRRRTWIPRSGKIVASRLDGDGHIAFQVAFKGAEGDVTFWNRFNAGSGFDPIGNDVDILVNPENASDAVVVRGAARPTVAGIIFLLFGAAATTIGLLLTASGLV